MEQHYAHGTLCRLPALVWLRREVHAYHLVIEEQRASFKSVLLFLCGIVIHISKPF